MKVLFFLATGLLSSWVHAQTYICHNQGLTIYTTVHINQSCLSSQLDGVSGSLNDEEDEISRVWQQAQFGSFDDTVILPRAPKPVVSLDKITPKKEGLYQARLQ